MLLNPALAVHKLIQDYAVLFGALHSSTQQTHMPLSMLFVSKQAAPTVT